MNISVSDKNSKLGKMGNFSLPPVKSCPNSKTCAVFVTKDGKVYKCYAERPYNQYDQTEAAWDRNFQIAQENLPEMENQLLAYFKSYNGYLFRIHVSGDFFDKEYLQMWLKIARKTKHVKFLVFTKMYGWFHKQILPENLTVLLSFMESHVTPEIAMSFAQGMGKLPAYVATERPEGYITCPEQTAGITCVQCKLCWKLPELKRPVGVHFFPH